MDIPALSMALSQSKLMDSFGTSVLAKTLDTAESEGAAIVSMLNSAPSAAAMELSVNPSVGANIDVYL